MIESSAMGDPDSRVYWFCALLLICRLIYSSGTQAPAGRADVT